MRCLTPLDINNTISYNWLTTVNNLDGEVRQFAVPKLPYRSQPEHKSLCYVPLKDQCINLLIINQPPQWQ
ncbi:MAG: hypothetical protein R2744_08125 [Bacteroidales bacterium]